MFLVLIACSVFLDARHGGAAGAANAAVRSLKRQMPADEASKILNIERSSMSPKQIDEVSTIPFIFTLIIVSQSNYLGISTHVCKQ